MRALLLPGLNGPASVLEVDDSDLPDGDVDLEVAYSSLNYKDGLAVTGQGKIVRGEFPFVPGIDLAGTVTSSRDQRWAPGDRVVLTGWGTGENRWGGYAEQARASADHLVRLPTGLGLEDAMWLGTAGLTAALSVLALED
ncbi:alcohol dehydrogenase catalytic domain-containing protein, partial [Rubrivirga sp.]|uniref:alcohol dehydrogenase catalytic domain-containing protein n=1 Tax=Rubrivirga sp. TaxID=1885344 RepID=UPI003C73DA06